MVVTVGAWADRGDHGCGQGTGPMRPCRVAAEESAPAGVGRQAAPSPGGEGAVTPSWQLAVVCGGRKRRSATAARWPVEAEDDML